MGTECSFVHLTFWLCIGLLARGVTGFAEFEPWAFGEPVLYFALVAMLGAGIAVMRRRRVDDVLFEDADTGAVQELGLGE